jgi:hypothetical protein
MVHHVKKVIDEGIFQHLSTGLDWYYGVVLSLNPRIMNVGTSGIVRTETN